MMNKSTADPSGNYADYLADTVEANKDSCLLYTSHDIVGLRLNAVLIGHKSQKYVKYHYKRNVYNWQCVMKLSLIHI